MNLGKKDYPARGGLPARRPARVEEGNGTAPGDTVTIRAGRAYLILWRQDEGQDRKREAPNRPRAPPQTL